MTKLKRGSSIPRLGERAGPLGVGDRALRGAPGLATRSHRSVRGPLHSARSERLSKHRVAGKYAGGGVGHGTAGRQRKDVRAQAKSARNHLHSLAILPEETEAALADAASALTLEEDFQRNVPAGSSTPAQAAVLEKARRVAELAKEAARVANVAASLENTIALPSAAGSSEAPVEASSLPLSRLRDLLPPAIQHADGSDASAPVVGEIRALGAASTAAAVPGTNKRLHRVRSARQRRWSHPKASASQAASPSPNPHENLDAVRRPGYAGRSGGDATSSAAPSSGKAGSSASDDSALEADPGNCGVCKDPGRMYRLLTADEEKMLSNKIKELKRIEDAFLAAFNARGRWPTQSEWAAEASMPAEDLDREYRDCLEAKQRMIMANVRLVQSVARRYRSSGGLSFDDLVQEGCLGLVRGAEKFDPSKGFKFSTYAHWWVRQSITRAVQDCGRDVRLPVHLHELMTKIRSVQESLKEDPCFLSDLGYGRKPSEATRAKLAGATNGSASDDSVEDIAAYLDVDVDRVQKVIKLMEQPISLESATAGSHHQTEDGLGEDGGTAHLEDIAQSLFGEDPDEDMTEMAHYDRLRTDVKHVLSTLSERERKIIAMRFGVLDMDPKTLEQIGKEFSVTRERIRQIECRAIRKLKDPERNSIIADYTQPMPVDN